MAPIAEPELEWLGSCDEPREPVFLTTSDGARCLFLLKDKWNRPYEQDARRLVAAWNATRDIPVDVLEKGVDVGYPGHPTTEALDLACRAYLCLLQSSERSYLDVQEALCACRDYIAACTGQSDQEVQEDAEERVARALAARIRAR